MYKDEGIQQNNNKHLFIYFSVVVFFSLTQMYQYVVSPVLISS